MTPINSELYKFFIEPQNFSTLFEIATDFPKFKKQLITEFWEEVIKELKILLEKSEWLYNLTDSLFDNYDGFSISLKSISLNGTSNSIGYYSLFDKPFITLWLSDIVKMDYKGIDRILQNDSTKKLGWKQQKANLGSNLLVKSLDINFETLSSNEKILPAYKKDFAKYTAEKLIEAGNDLKELILQIDQKRK